MIFILLMMIGYVWIKWEFNFLKINTQYNMKNENNYKIIITIIN